MVGENKQPAGEAFGIFMALRRFRPALKGFLPHTIIDVRLSQFYFCRIL